MVVASTHVRFIFAQLPFNRYAVTNNDFYQFLLKVVLVAGSFLTAILVAVSRYVCQFHHYDDFKLTDYTYLYH